MVIIESTPVLYRFGLSVWAAVAELAVAELYPEGAIEQKTISIPAGDNFAPSFLEINEKATLPTLTVGDKTFTSTETVVQWLVKNAPSKVQGGDYELIRKVHEDAYDPNFALIFARSKEELKTKSAGFPKGFAQGRQDALDKWSATPEGAKYSDFYSQKKTANGGLLALLTGNASESGVEHFIAQSNAVWSNIIHLITVDLPEILPTSGFIGGERPGETDFHYGGYLARITMSQGVGHVKELEQSLGKPVPQNVVAYWDAWVVRESWKKVYAETLH